MWSALNWGTKSDYSHQVVQEAINNTDFLVSARTKSGQLVGLTRVISDGLIYTSIADIAVHPNFQNQGIGQRMMDFVKKKYGTSGIFVNVLKENEDFFKKCGYQKRVMEVYSKRFISK